MVFIFCSFLAQDKKEWTIGDSLKSRVETFDRTMPLIQDLKLERGTGNSSRMRYSICLTTLVTAQKCYPMPSINTHSISTISVSNVQYILLHFLYSPAQ